MLFAPLLLCSALAQEPAPPPPDPPPPVALDPSPRAARALAYGGGVGRVLVGAAPIVAYGPTTSLMGFPADQDNPTARAMAGLFGVRDIALGALVMDAAKERRPLRRAFLLNLAVDLGDAAVLSAPLISRQGIDAGAGRSLGMALGGATFWTVGLLLLRAP